MGRRLRGGVPFVRFGAFDRSGPRSMPDRIEPDQSTVIFWLATVVPFTRSCAT